MRCNDIVCREDVWYMKKCFIFTYNIKDLILSYLAKNKIGQLNTEETLNARNFFRLNEAERERTKHGKNPSGIFLTWATW